MRKAAILGMFGAMTLALPVMAQEQPPRGPGRDGPPPMRRMQPPGFERIKEALNVSDEKWKALEPKIQKVQELRRDLNVRAGPMMFGGPSGFGGPGGRGMLQGRRGFRGGQGGPGNDDAGAPPPPPGADNQPLGAPGGAGGPPPADQNGAGGPPPGDPNGAGGPPPGGPEAGNRLDGRRDGARRPGARHRSDVQAKFEDLQALLDEKEPKPEDLKAKIQAFHDAQTKGRAQLNEAEDDLRTAVNPLQEAILITTGVLN